MIDRAAAETRAPGPADGPEFSGPSCEVCSLCGLPVGRSKARQVIDGKTHRFCCLGCSHVFLILRESSESMSAGDHTRFEETELYRTCVAAGLIPQGARSDEGTLAPPDADASTVAPGLSGDVLEGLAHNVTLRIEGMWCSSCSWVIEEVLRKAPGVLDARVSFHSDLAQLKYLSHITTLQDLSDRILRLGYRALPVDDKSRGDKNGGLLPRLGISAILTMNIMMISSALYSGFFHDLSSAAVGYFSYPLWLLATPVVFYGGLPIIDRAGRGLLHGHVSMDTLITVGVLSAYLYSVAGVARGSIHLYFDTASMLVTLVLLGGFIEAKAKERVSAGIDELRELTGGKARLWHEGREKWVGSASVEAGDEVLVAAAERVPVDGTIVEGRGSVDESIITGESRRKGRSVGDRVSAGALLVSGGIRLRALNGGLETSLSRMVALMENAVSRKSPVELFADRITRRFVPFIFLLAAATASTLLLKGAGVDEALLRALTVLVITCPCALGIAVPLAKTASIGIARANGVLIRDPDALERARDLDVIVFDKTGTLTEGNFSLKEVISPGYDRDRALALIASVEANSDHLLAEEILRRAGADGLKIEEAAQFRSRDGLGVSGVVDGMEILVGNRGLMEDRGMILDEDLNTEARLRESMGLSTVFFGWGRKVEGLLVFGDTLKENAKKTVSQLRGKGIDVWMVSGDSRETTRAVAVELALNQYVGQALPAEKVDIIEGLQARGLRVAMVGDGINDASALARADVSVAIGALSNITREASDITLISTDPIHLLTVRKLSVVASRIIRQNLFFAFLYNVLAIPLAITGTLNPLIAVLAMFASSLTVIANTLRISGHLCSEKRAN